MTEFELKSNCKICLCSASEQKKEKMKKIAILPIRSGSKRIPNKNFYPIGGVPLFVYVLSNICKSDIFDNIIVATDDINRTALATTKFLKDKRITLFERSEKSASDNAKTEEVIEEVVNEFSFESTDWLIFFQATNPFVRDDYLRSLFEKIDSGKFNSVFSAVKKKRFKASEVIEPTFDRARTQDLQPEIYETGLFWAIKKSTFSRFGNRIGDKSTTVIIGESDDVDIDYLEDLQAVEHRLKFSRIKENNNFTIRKIRKELSTGELDPDGKVTLGLENVQGRLDFGSDEINLIKGIRCNFNHKCRVLDIGCGIGVISREAFGPEANITGIEPSSITSKLASTRLDEVHADFYENVTPELASGNFDFVLAFHVIEHVNRPNHFLDEIFRLLKPGGLMLISTPDFGGPLAKKYGEGFRLLHDPTHCSLFDTVGLLNSCVSRGFLLEDLIYPFVDTPYMTRENLLRLLDNENKISPPFTGNVVSMLFRK